MCLPKRYIKVNENEAELLNRDYVNTSNPEVADHLIQYSRKVRPKICILTFDIQKNECGIFMSVLR